MRRGCFAVLMSIVVLAAAGCGGSVSKSKDPGVQSSGGGSNELAASDAADVLTARRAIDDSCAASQSDASGSSEDLQQGAASILRITSLYPDFVYEIGSDSRAEEMTIVAKGVVAELQACKHPELAKPIQDLLARVD